MSDRIQHLTDLLQKKELQLHELPMDRKAHRATLQREIKEMKTELREREQQKEHHDQKEEVEKARSTVQKLLEANRKISNEEK
jgi:hypothetical protein